MTPIGLECIVLFGAHRWHHQHMISQVAPWANHLLVVVEDKHEFPPTCAEGVEFSILHTSSDWTPRELERIVKEARSLSPHGRWTSLAFDDYSAPAAAVVSAQSTVPCYSEEAAVKALHKYRLRDLWNQQCRENPSDLCAPVAYSCLEWEHFDAGENATLVAGTHPNMLRYPVIVKPDCLDGSVGVTRCCDPGELRNNIQHTLSTMKHLVGEASTVGLKMPSRVLIEEEIRSPSWFDGHGEFSAQMLSRDGSHHLCGVTDKIRGIETFAELGHVFPSVGFPQLLLPRLENSLTVMLATLGVQNAITSWDFMLEARTDVAILHGSCADLSIALIEGQLRPSGNHIMELYRRACEIEPFEALLSSLASTSLKRRLSPVAAVFLLEAEEPLETISHVEGWAPSEESNFDLSIDTRLYSQRGWKGRTAGSESFVRLIGQGASIEVVVEEARRLCDALRMRGRDSSGCESTVRLKLPSGQLGDKSGRLGRRI